VKSLVDADHFSKRLEGETGVNCSRRSLSWPEVAPCPRQPTEPKCASELPSQRRVPTGRDEAGKSVFKSFDVPPTLVDIDSNPSYAAGPNECCDNDMVRDRWLRATRPRLVGESSVQRCKA
jgi:hypothetical protein